MNNRTYIRGTILLCDDTTKNPIKGQYTILKKMETEGASSICYTAKNPQGIKGILKEFYPLNANLLVRDENNQLIQLTDIEQEALDFKHQLAEYINPYRLLCKIRENDDLATVIPPYEVLFGCDEEGKIIGTAYIWSPFPACVTFKDMLKDIHSDIADRPEYKLVQILYSIESLVNAICVLHNAGLVHCDINPSNFGFSKLGSKILTQTISLFDVDTICSVYNPPVFNRGTDGFIEPEYVNSKPNNLTDIFAIGASLFSAIIVTDETRSNNFVYQYSYYDRLPELIEASELLQEAAANIHPNLKAVLLTILQKTLCLRDERYHSCDELLTDIESALYYVIPIEISDRGKAGKKWILSDVEHFFSKSHEKNVMLTLQHHLYTHPLYIRQSSTDALNVLIVGFDMYSQKFLDQVLQIAQMPKIVLNIEVIYDNPQEKELYLYQRPELRNFFNVDGSLDEVDDNYGTVKFTNYSLSEENLNILIKNISEKQSQTVSDYIFISSGRDKLNLLIAKSLNIKSPINIVWEGTQHISQKKLGTITPVYISEDISQLPFRKELERMAFNVHLIWNKNLNVDYNSVRCEYLKPYNRYSCISFIVAMKYKLHGLGIDLDKVGTKRAAYEYQRYISDNTEQKNILSCFEHRRWVTEKICLGYCKITDLEYCATGLTKDEKKKKHVCILRSTPDTPLKSKKWYRITQKQPIKEKWDNPRPQDLAKLDDLDRMSVELHLMFKKHAKLEQENDLLNGQLILDLRKQTEYDSDCVVALQELLTCMKDIWDGNIDQCNRYEGLKQKFLKTVKKSNVLYDRNKHSINKLWGALQDKFYPIFASMLYRDYKLDDIKLINGIPFILTYSESIYMAIPYSTGTNNDIFSNLAAATVINPAKILYFAYCSNQKDLAKIEQTLTYIIQYMNKKPIRAKIEFIIGFTIRSGICNNSEIEHKLKQSSGGRVKRVSLVAAESPKEFATILKEYLITRNKRKSNFLIEFNNTLLAGLLDGLNLYEQLPSYSYNPTLMEFSVHHDADMITYIQKEPYITATDMFSLKEASSETSNKPEFFADYKKLWQLYKESTVAWKNVCHILGEYSEKMIRLYISVAVVVNHNCHSIATLYHLNAKEQQSISYQL